MLCAYYNDYNLWFAIVRFDLLTLLYLVKNQLKLRNTFFVEREFFFSVTERLGIINITTAEKNTFVMNHSWLG